MQIHVLDFEKEIDFILSNGVETQEISAKVCSYSDEIYKFMEVLKQKTLVPFIFMDMDDKSSRILHMWSSGWTVAISAVIDKQHYSFVPEDIKPVTLPSGKKYLIIFDVDNVEKQDRRRATRFPVGLPGLMIYWRALEPVHIKIRDISATGIGILMSKEEPCAVRDKLCISFDLNGTTQTVNAQIVNITDYGKDTYLLGCIRYKQ